MLFSARNFGIITAISLLVACSTTVQNTTTTASIGDAVVDIEECITEEARHKNNVDDGKTIAIEIGVALALAGITKAVSNNEPTWIPKPAGCGLFECLFHGNFAKAAAWYSALVVSGGGAIGVASAVIAPSIRIHKNNRIKTCEPPIYWHHSSSYLK